MTSRLRFGVLGATALALVATPLLPQEASAQAASRFRVMVTNLMPAEGADDDFGKDLAKELRKLINELPTHQPVEEKEIKDEAKRFDMDMEDLNCIRSLQLASQIDAELVMCGTYTQDRDAKTVSLSGVQFAAPGGATFAIDDKVWGEKEHKEAAQEIFNAFGTYVDQLRVAQFCGDYFNSKSWDSAVEQCTRAIEMNPEDSQVRYIYARTLMELDRNEEAYEEVKQVIELDQLHEDALQTAGFLAITLDRRDEGRQFYNTYLQLNPGNAGVRMQIAYDMAQAGDPGGAMILIEEGLDIEADNVDLLTMHAGFAMAAAGDAREGMPQDEPLPDEARELYEKAMGSYDAVYAVKGSEMDGAQLRNMIAVRNDLNQVDEAVAMAERALETHDSEAAIWSAYADVLKKSERVDDAISALDRVRELDAEYPNVAVRQGNWLLEAGRVDDALSYLRTAVQNSEQSPDVVARILLANGYANGVTPKNWPYAIRMIEMGKTFELSDGVAGELDFWHGFSLYNQGREAEQPQTLQSAQATLPQFQLAARLFALPRVAAYADTQPSIVLQQFRDATQQYIEIQEAIIQRGSR